MKKAEEVTAKIGDNVYHLLLTGYYTALIDDSGTGKSMLASDCRFVADGTYNLECQCKIIGSDDYYDGLLADIKAVINSIEGGIIVLDEQILNTKHEDTILELKDILFHIVNPNIRFILIGRNIIQWLPLGVHDLMAIVNEGNNYYFRRLIEIPYSSATPWECTRVIFEDSTSGYKVGYPILANRGYSNCIRGFGKNNIISRYFPEYKSVLTSDDKIDFEPSIMIIDLCGDAWEYLLLSLLMQAGYKMFIVNTESFEWECLVAHGSISRNEQIDPRLFEPVMTEEEYYTRLLGDETEKEGHSRYRKDLSIIKKIMIDYGFLKEDIYPELPRRGDNFINQSVTEAEAGNVTNLNKLTLE